MTKFHFMDNGTFEHCQLRMCVKAGMFAYLEGSAVGDELEEKIKCYKSSTFTSHRRVGVNIEWICLGNDDKNKGTYHRRTF